MNRWKKLATGIILAAALSQIPFAYRRIQLGRLSDRIHKINATRTQAPASPYKHFSGAIHVHTSLGGHSRATLEDLIEGAKGLDFVIITEHTANLLDTAALTLNGTYDGILFVGGNELDTHTSDRLLLVPGTHEAYLRRNTETPEFLPPFREEGRLAFVTYPDRFNSWTTTDYDGVEVFNLSTSTRSVNYVLFVFDMLWAHFSYPDLTLATHLSRPDANLAKYDEAAKTRRLALFAGSDAHSNIGFHLFADETGKSLIKVKFDDYGTVFRVVKTHVLIDRGQPLSQESLLNALRQGHCYIGFDVLGDTEGFQFTAGANIQGDEVSLAEKPVLKVSVPLQARIVLLKDGAKVAESASSTSLTFSPTERGSYRVEVFHDALGKPFNEMPWIFSNPIYVR